MMTRFILNAVNYSVSNYPVGIFNSLSRSIDTNLINSTLILELTERLKMSLLLRGGYKFL